jgi:hypothetical protein
MTTRLLAAACIVASPFIGYAQTLTDSEVQAAIATRATGLELTERRMVGSNGFRAVLHSPRTWIATRAAEAKQRLQPFTAEHVTDEMRQPVWRVIVYPRTPKTMARGSIERASSVRHVVLMNRSRSTVVQPRSVTPFDITSGNALGATMTLHGLTATFAVDEVAPLIAGGRLVVAVRGDFEAEHDFDVNAQQLEKLR